MRALLPEVTYTILVKLTQRGRPIMDDELANRVQRWFEAQCAAIFTRDEIDIAAEQAKRRDTRLASADKMARMTGLTWEDRQHFGIRTIAAADKTECERTVLSKERKRDRDREQKRRERGSISRAEYLETCASERREPWKALGMTRATYYRRQRETRLSQISSLTPSDNLVSPAPARS
jgi:hypothetical protein